MRRSGCQVPGSAWVRFLCRAVIRCRCGDVLRSALRGNCCPFGLLVVLASWLSGAGAFARPDAGHLPGGHCLARWLRPSSSPARHRSGRPRRPARGDLRGCRAAVGPGGAGGRGRGAGGARRCPAPGFCARGGAFRSSAVNVSGARSALAAHGGLRRVHGRERMHGGFPARRSLLLAMRASCARRRASRVSGSRSRRIETRLAAERRLRRGARATRIWSRVRSRATSLGIPWLTA